MNQSRSGQLKVGTYQWVVKTASTEPPRASFQPCGKRIFVRSRRVRWASTYLVVEHVSQETKTRPGDALSADEALNSRPPGFAFLGVVGRLPRPFFVFLFPPLKRWNFTTFPSDADVVVQSSRLRHKTYECGVVSRTWDPPHIPPCFAKRSEVLTTKRNAAPKARQRETRVRSSAHESPSPRHNLRSKRVARAGNIWRRTADEAGAARLHRGPVIVLFLL